MEVQDCFLTIWQCLDSNNDATFNPSKWAILSQADTTLNALDRIQKLLLPQDFNIKKN